MDRGEGRTPTVGARPPLGAGNGAPGRWLPAVAGVAALAVAAATARGRGRELDRRLYRAVNGDGGRAADTFFKAITELGSIWAPVGAAAVLARRGRGREGLDALGAAAAMWGLGQVLKRAVLRPRPYDALPDHRLLIHRPRGTSWPSSHPAVLLAFVTVASRNLGLSPGARAWLVALTGAVGVSRVYLGVHFPSDVVGGLLLGRAVADLWTALRSPAPPESLRSPAVPGFPRSGSVPGTVS